MGDLCSTGVEELPTATKVVSGTELPEWVSAGGREIYEQSRELARSPFPLYEGQRIATFEGLDGGISKMTEAEQRAAQLLTDESGAYRPYFEGAVQRTQDLAPTYEGMTSEQLIGSPVDTGTFDIAAAQPFLETYQQAVDPAIRELERRTEAERRAQAARASQAGAFGGSRAAIEDVLLGTESAANIADLRKQAAQEGLSFAAQQYQADRQARLEQAELDRQARFGAEEAARSRYDIEQVAGLRKAEALASFAPMIQGLQEQQASGMITAGQAQRELDQMALDLAYADYVEQREYPYAMLNFALGALKGVPFEQRTIGLEQGQQFVQTPSVYGQTISGLGSLASAYYLANK